MANTSGGSSDEYETDEYHRSDRESDDDFMQSRNMPRSFPASLAAGGENKAKRENSGTVTADRGGENDEHSGNSSMLASKPEPSEKSDVVTKPGSERKQTNKSRPDGDKYSNEQESAQKYALGTMVSKMFDTGNFLGKIVDYHAKERHYTIRYEDGDKEDLSEDELEVLLEKKKKGDHANEMTNHDSKGDESDDSLCEDVKMQATRNNNHDSDDSDSEDPFSHLGRSKSNKRKVLELSSDEDDSDEESDGSHDDGRRNKLGSKVLKKTTVHSSDSENSDDDYFTTRKPNTVAAKQAVAKNKTVIRRSELGSSSDSDVELITSPCDKANKPAAATGKSYLSGSSSGYFEKKNMTNPSLTKQSSRCSLRLPVKPIQHDPSVRADSERALEQVKAAKAALLRAQGYHAEELEVNVPSPEPQSQDPVTSRNVLNIDDDSSLEAVAVAPTEMICTGSAIQLSLRYQDASKKDSNVTLRIKTDEPLKNLNERFQSQYGGLITSLKFDGQTLDMNKTPQFYEMEDEDLVDAVVKSSVGTITIYVRRAGSSSPHEFKMSNMVPLSKLVSSYCTKYKLSTINVEYNGRRLDPTKSCHLEGIPNNAYLDAVMSGASAGGQTINLEFRVNGDSRDMHSVSVLPSGSFESAMIAFAERRNCSLTECKFIFDGEVLQQTTTVESLDLEGGEIIDVKITASAVETPPLQDDDGDVIMTETAAAVISVKTCRNVSPSS